MKRGRATRALYAAVAFACIVSPGRAAGQRLSADLAASDAHVREARRLAERGRIVEACSELERAQRDYPRSAVLLELANCYQAAGYPGTASETLRLAQELAAAEQAGSSLARAEAARTRIEQGTARVRIVVSSTLDPSSLEVHLDTRPIVVTRDSVHVVDPELLTALTHVVEVTAPGRVTKRWELRLGPGEEKTIVVDDLPLERPAGAVTSTEELAIDRSTGARVETRPGTAPWRVSASEIATFYRITEAAARPLRVDGAGIGWTTLVRLSYTTGPFTVGLSQSVTAVFDVPGIGEGALAAGSPVLSASYRFAFGKYSLATSLNLSPPVLPLTTTPALRFARTVGLNADPGTYNARSMNVGPVIAFSGPLVGPLNGAIGARSINSFPVEGDRGRVHAVLWFVRFAVKIAIVTPVVGLNYFTFLRGPEGASNSLTLLVGTSIAVTPSTQLSTNVLRTVYNPAGSTIDAWVVDLGVATSF